MATIYKAGDRPNWMIAWFDGTGRRRVRSSGTTDRKVAEQLASRLENTATMQREGLVDPRQEIYAKGSRTSLREHAEAFCQYLEHKGSTRSHVVDRRGQLDRLLSAMHATRVADLTPARAQRGLAVLRETRGISLRTVGHHVRAIRALARWLAREGLVAADPLVGLSAPNADTERRHERRALTRDEIGKLLAAAEVGATYVGLSGPDRKILYSLALGTGFRASEIGSLTPESFSLNGNGDGRDRPPTVTVKAGYSKNRRESVQPIREDLASALRTWLAGKPAGLPVFPSKDLAQRTAMIMKRDLAAAGIPYIDDEGRVADFHALRHTYITEVVKAGASVKEAQTLARHATAELTFRVYAHARLHDLKGTLEKMPGTSVVAVEKAG